MTKTKGILGLIGFMTAVFVFSSAAQAEEVRKAIVTKVRGPVEVRMGEELWSPAAKGMMLYETHEIRTGVKGFAEIYLDEDAEAGKLELKEKSHLRLSTMDMSGSDKETYLDLALGKVLVHAEKLKGNSKFEVKTPNASAGVRGTVFEVSVEEQDS